MAGTLEKYAEYLIDRLFDLKAALQAIERGAKDPRMIARTAIVDDDRAQLAIKSEFEMTLRAVNHDNTH